MNYILIGYRGTGKTSAGRAAAGRLGLAFHDTDEIINKETGKSVKEIVESGGWKAFRELEALAVRSLPHSGSHVISLGGGAVLDPRNVEELRKKQAAFIWLFADAATISLRIAQDGNSSGLRPALNGPGDDIAVILRERTPIYRGLADYLIDASGRSIDEIAESICRFIKTFGRGQ